MRRNNVHKGRVFKLNFEYVTVIGRGDDSLFGSNNAVANRGKCRGLRSFKSVADVIGSQRKPTGLYFRYVVDY
jgi:hypothetical protein